MAERIEFDLLVKENQLNKALDQGTKKAVSLEGALETALGVLSGNLALKAIESLIGGFNSLVDIGKESIDAAAAQEVATNNLNNALARQGNFTKQASKDLLDFAASVQQTTVFEDDAIIANTALLQSLTKLNTEGLKQGVSAAADFATVLGIDLETATRLVAKAAEGNTEAFKRYGVEIKKGSSDSESFSNTLDALNRQFGGSSAAQLNTYSGSLKALGNAYSDLLEPVGEIITKNPVVISLFKEIKDIINGTNKDVSALVPSLQELVTDGFLAASSAAQVLLDGLSGVVAVVQVLAGTFQNISGLIGQTIIAPFELVIDSVIFLGSKIPVLGEAFKNLANPLDGATEAMNKLASEGINKIVTSLDGNFVNDISNGLNNLTNSVIENSASVAIASAEAIKNNNDRKTNENEVNAEIVKSRLESGNALLIAQQSLANEEAAFRLNQAAVDLEIQGVKDETALQRIRDQKIAEADVVYQGELLKNKAITDEQTRLASNLAAADNLARTKLKANGEFQIAEAKRVAAENIKNQESFFNSAISLSSVKNKEIALIGKAAALTQLAIKTPEAIANSFAFGTKLGGPPLGFALGAVAATAMAAQAAQIAGVGFEQGGIVGQTGAVAGADNRVATIKDGEMILNASQQQKLFNMIEGGGNGGGNIQVIIDGREVAVAVRNQIQSGFRLA